MKERIQRRRKEQLLLDCRRKEGNMKKEKGSMGDMLAACICMLAMTVLMLSYMGSVGVVFQKAAVSQLARKYILRMETVGELTAADRTVLLQELESLGATEITLEGTSGKAAYGEPIELRIRGKLKDTYEFEEKRVSTAKN